MQKKDDWFTSRLEKTLEKRLKMGLAHKSNDGGSPQAAESQVAIVREDDVCVQVIGLPAKLTPEAAFAGIYGLAERPLAWQIPNTDFELFVAASKFYHRDQLVPVEGPLAGLGVNFHGELRLTADRTEIVQNHVLFWQYQIKLKEALDIAIQRFPDLAVRILDSFLSAPNNRYAPKPGGTMIADQYRSAFETVCRTRRPDLFESGKNVFPYSRSRSTEDEPILHELDFVPWPLQDWQLDVLKAAGAYTSPAKFSEALFLGSPKLTSEELAGADLFQKLVGQIKSQTSLAVSIVKYPYSKPRCVVRDGLVFLAHPKPCKRCQTEGCHCWIGPALIRVAENLTGEEEPDLERVFEIYDEGRDVREVQTPTTRASRSSKINAKDDEESLSEGGGDSWRESLTDISDVETEDDDGDDTIMEVDGFPDRVCVRPTESCSNVLLGSSCAAQRTIPDP